MEWDVNTPWYRPTRVMHVTSGSEFGYRNGAGKWPAGTEGTVVSDYGDHKEVEISDDRGVALDYVIVPVEQLQLVTKYS